MEETLTDCLVRVREDLTNLNKVRDYLNANGDTGRQCTITWRTIEAFNSILTVCSSQDGPQTNALDTLLDSFYFLARNNAAPRVWRDFGFEMGIISAKILSAIDRSDTFDILFYKLLTIINIITEHDTTIWKSSARQILNIFINKKFPLSYFETVLKLYISILRNVENFSLTHFSTQNLHLLKTISNLVQRIGDFEIQSDIMELVFLHFSQKTESMLDFFSPVEKKLFDSLPFTDFEKDTRTYLNAINKQRKGFERKIFSISSRMLYFGGCSLESPIGGNFLWVDANKDTERLSVRCADVNSNTNRVIYIKFSDITKLNLSSDKNEVKCLTIQTKSLRGLQFDIKNNEIRLMAENGENLSEFMNFLNGEIKNRQKNDRKLSKTRISLFIDRTKMQELQDNAITSSQGRKVENILPENLNLFERNEPTEIKSSQSSKSLKVEMKSPRRSQDRATVAELSPNSFVASLNEHIGRESSEMSHTFENSVETIEFLQKNNPHRLFRTPEKLFDDAKPTKLGNQTEKNNFSFIFDEEKENEPIVEKFQQKVKTYERKRETKQKSKPLENSPAEKVLRNKKILEMQSQDYFRHNLLTKKKPCLPKFKRKPRTKPEDENKQEKHETSVTFVARSDKNEEKLKKLTKVNEDRKTNEENKNREKKIQQPQQTKPSLLDPNSYAFKRWCEPTTSERSNFWLKKLHNGTKKSKTENDKTFDFSEDSDSISTKMKRKKRKVVTSKRKHKTRQTSLKEVKEILKKGSPKEKPTNPHEDVHPEEFVEFSPDKQQQQPEIASKRSSSPESIQKNKMEETNEEEENVRKEDEENIKIKKQVQRSFHLSGKMLTSLQNRLLVKEQKDRQQTDEIMETVRKSVNFLFNHLQRKEGKTVLSYLATAEEAAGVVEYNTADLKLRARRIQRAMLYYKAGCSVSEMCETLEGQLSEVRNSLEKMTEEKDVFKTINRVNDRLLSLIKSSVDKAIDNELATKRKKLLKCASIFMADYGDLP